MTIAIGIDLGTNFTAVGVYLNGEIHIIPNDNGKKFIPSYVSFTSSERLIGEPAECQSISNQKNTVFGVKRFIGRRFDDPCLKEDMKLFPYTIKNFNGNPRICVTYKNKKRVYDPEEISAMIIKKVKQSAEIMLGHQINSAVITVPSFFNDSQRQATKDAGSIAGLDVLHMLNESTAAAIAYGLDKTTKDEKNVLIYDLGSGTFETSILKIKQGNAFEVQSTVGDTHLGGVDFDNLMVNYFADMFLAEHGKEIREDIYTVRRLRLACERAKIILSDQTKAKVIVDALVDSIDFAVSISRSKFEKICEPLFNRTIELLEQALIESGLSKKEIDDVVMVGSSSKIPKVHSLVSNYFEGKYISRCINPNETVTYGAAVKAAFLSGFKDERIKDLMFVDVTSLSIGIETTGGIMTIIIERNTSIPCRATYSVTTFADNQPTVVIQVFEGERALTSDNHRLGKLELHGLPPLPRKVPQIEITFEIDSNGILIVSAEEKSCTKSKSISIRLDKGRLSPEDIHRNIKEAEEFQKEDEEKRERIRFRNLLESYVESIDQAVFYCKSKISDRDKLEIQKICNEVYDWLRTNPTIDKFSLIKKRRKTIKLLQPYVPTLGLSVVTDNGFESVLASGRDE